MNEFFKSEGNKIAFALNYLDGENRMKVLGITFQHFTRSKKDKQWYDETKEKLSNENMLDGITKEKLDRLYKEMI